MYCTYEISRSLFFFDYSLQNGRTKHCSATCKVIGGGWGGYVECTIIGALSVTEEKECEDGMHIPHVTCMMYTSLYSIKLYNNIFGHPFYILGTARCNQETNGCWSAEP